MEEKYNNKRKLFNDVKSLFFKMFKRIISLAPSNTEIIYALNADDNLIAVTRYCDYPENALKKPRIGGWLDVNEKLIQNYNLDLIITSTFVQKKIAQKYKKMGMNVKSFMPTTLAGVFNSILDIGALLNKNAEAKSIVQDMKHKINAIKAKYEKCKYAPRLYIEEWHKPPTVSGNWVPTLARFARAN